MTDTKKNDRCGKMKWFVIGSALTLVGFIIVPPFIKKYGNKVYKKSLYTDSQRYFLYNNNSTRRQKIPAGPGLGTDTAQRKKLPHETHSASWGSLRVTILTAGYPIIFLS